MRMYKSATTLYGIPDELAYMNSLRKQIIELFVIKVKFQPILLA